VAFDETALNATIWEGANYISEMLAHVIYLNSFFTRLSKNRNNKISSTTIESTGFRNIFPPKHSFLLLLLRFFFFSS
jgi:hypothetical protein